MRPPPATPACSRTFSSAHRSPPQCASPHNLRALRAQLLLSKFSTFLPPRNRRQCRRGRSACAASTRAHPVAATRQSEAPSKSARSTPSKNSSSSSTAAVDPQGQPPLPSLWPPGDQADDRLGSVWMWASRRSCRRVPCTDSATTSYEMAPFLMPLDRDTEHSPRTRVSAVIARQ